MFQVQFLQTALYSSNTDTVLGYMLLGVLSLTSLLLLVCFYVFYLSFVLSTFVVSKHVNYLAIGSLFFNCEFADCMFVHCLQGLLVELLSHLPDTKLRVIFMIFTNRIIQARRPNNVTTSLNGRNNESTADDVDHRGTSTTRHRVH